MPIQIDPDKDGITKEDILELGKLGIAVRWPENFYKYYRINDNFLSSIREGYLWLSQPEGFNDPFDARLLLDTESSVEEIDAHISKVFESSPLKEDARKIYTDE